MQPVQRDGLASMGPRLLRRGNIPTGQDDFVLPGASMGPRLLRRGNGDFFFIRPRHGKASMGPRLLRRGNGVWRTGVRRRGSASMGPRLLRRGNLLPFFDGLPVSRASMGPRLLRRGNRTRASGETPAHLRHLNRIGGEPTAQATGVSPCNGEDLPNPSSASSSASPPNDLCGSPWASPMASIWKRSFASDPPAASRHLATRAAPSATLFGW